MTSVGPTLSVVIPTRDRPALLASALEALREQRWPFDSFEVIVVDDGSRTPVSLPEFDLQVKLVRQHHKGPAAARNLGSQHASGEFLIFMDDDCLPGPNWLGEYAEALTQRPDTALGGDIGISDEANRYLQVSEWIVNAALRHFDCRPGGGFFLRSANLAVPAALFRQVGQFDPAFHVSEDREFLDRWLWRGYAAAALPTAWVLHQRPMDLVGFWRTHFRYGRGAYRFHELRSRRRSGRWNRDYLGYYVRVFRDCPVRPRALALALLVLWQMANLFGFLAEMSKEVQCLRRTSSS